jgi:hypothetical protein
MANNFDFEAALKQLQKCSYALFTKSAIACVMWPVFTEQIDTKQAAEMTLDELEAKWGDKYEKVIRSWREKWTKPVTNWGANHHTVIDLL